MPKTRHRLQLNPTHFGTEQELSSHILQANTSLQIKVQSPSLLKKHGDSIRIVTQNNP